MATGVNGRTWVGMLAMAWLIEAEGWARDFRVNQIPNGTVNRCANCHVNPNGGGARNAFGNAVGAIVGGPSNRPFWSASLAVQDSDRDGFTNGQELGDPDGDGTPVPGAPVANPGSASSTPPANQPPTVTLNAPANGTALAGPVTVILEAQASDTDGTVATVEFLDGATRLGEDPTSPYSLRAVLGVGSHSLTARATDNQGTVTTSAAVQVTITEPAVLTLGPLTRTGDAWVLSWAGGAGPFVAQHQTGLGQTWSAVGPVTLDRSVNVPVGGSTGFLRVADFVTGGPLELHAVLSGAAERPTPVVTSATGSGTFRLEGSLLTVDVQYSGLSGPAIGAHIHGPATVEQAAPVLIDLAPLNGGAFGTSGTLSGSVAVTPAEKAAILGGLTYVNLHTAANQGGEIRGQLVP